MKKSIIIILLLLSTFYLVNDGETISDINSNKIENISEMNNIPGTQISNNKKTDPGLDIIETNHIAEEWKEGRTVHIEKEFQNAVVNELVDTTGAVTSYAGGISATFLDDTSYQITSSTVQQNCETNVYPTYSDYCYAFGNIYRLDATHSGSITTIGNGWMGGAQSGYKTLVGTTGSEHLSNNEILVKVEVQSAFDHLVLTGYNQRISYSLFFFDFSNEVWDYQASSGSSFSYDIGGTPAVSTWDLYVDYISYDPDSVAENIRSHYKYTSDTSLLHSLEININEFGSIVEIFSSDGWNLSSITPVVSYQWDSSTESYNFTSMDINIYTLLFTQQSNYFMALKDVSSNYLECPDFECGDYSDWIEPSIATFNDKSINSSIVNEGSYSLRLESVNQAAEHDFALTNLDDGYYYISFSYYFDGTPDSTWRIYYYNSGWTTDFGFDTSITNKWVDVFLYFQIQGIPSDDRQFNIYSHPAADGVLFIDNVKLFKPSGNIETSKLNEYDITGSFISWDNVENPSLSNHDVELSFRDATDIELVSTTLTTDSQGIASYSYENSLSSQEYIVEFYSKKSWFGGLGYEEYIETSDYNFLGGSGTIGVEEDSIYFTSGSSSIAFNIETISEDWSNIDYIVFDTKANKTATIDRTNFRDDASTYNAERSTDQAITNTFETYIFDISDYSLALGPSIDYTLIEDFYFIFTSQNPIKFNLNNFRAIQSQKSYITPISSEDLSGSILYETDDSYFLSSTNDTGLHYFEVDSYFGYVEDLEFIPMNLSVGTHSLNIIRIYDYSIDENLVQLSGTWQNTTYTISETIEKTLVHFFYSNLAGVGLDFTTAQLWINDSRMYSEEWLFDPGTLLNITVKTLFNTTIFNEEVTVEEATDQDIILVIPLYIQYFVNTEDIPMYVHMNHTYFNTSFVLNANESIQMFVIQDTYNFTISPLKDSVNNGTHIFTYSAKTLTNVSLPDTDRRVYFSLDLSAAEIEGDSVNDIVKNNIPPEYWRIATLILTGLMVFLGFAALQLLYKLAQVFLEFTGMSLWNVMVGEYTGKKIYKRKDYIISDRKPTDNPFTEGIGDGKN